MNKTLIGSLALGSIVGLASAGANATSNPFAVTDLGHGYQVAAADKDTEAKCGEAKCGAKESKEKEAKCGEAVCGENMDTAKPSKEDKKDTEGKCGEGKCGGST